jgi:hypothetical protein
MVDRNRVNFEGRIGRIEKMHASGAGFEAEGTLGMAYYNSLRPTQRRRSTWLLPLALIALTVIVIKAGILSQIGADAYAARVAELSQGTFADRLGAYVLTADPLTEWVAALLGNRAG